jgi:aspartyl/asparaginyl beta-hydroxylase (cupin superfamily)
MSYSYLIKEPEFWEQSYLEKIPYCKDLLENFEEIKKEIIDFREKIQFIEYPKYQVQRRPLYENSWKAFPVSRFHKEHIELVDLPYAKLVENARSNLPILNRLITPLEKINVLSNSFMSILSPGSVINPHRGWCKKYLRVHLCIIEDLQCKITIGRTTQTWKEGTLIAFKDGGIYMHSVKHKGTRDRIVFSTDLDLKYLDEFIPRISG